MLTELDQKLIQKEIDKFSKWDKDFYFIFLMDCQEVYCYTVLLNNYDIFEFTEHWYDSGPRFSETAGIRCELCDKKCSKCEIYQKWDKSEEQLSFESWIDVWGPGIWGDDQEKANLRVKNIFEEELFKDDDFPFRSFYYLKDDVFEIFYYNRDRVYEDYWFVFKKKAATQSKEK